MAKIKLQITDYKGNPIPEGSHISFFGKGGFFSSGEKKTARSDYSGSVTVNLKFNFIEKVTIDGLIIKKSWDISGKNEIEERIQLPSPEEMVDAYGGIKGRLYWSDGTRVHTEVEVGLRLPSYSDEKVYKSTSKDNGSFAIPLPRSNNSKEWMRSINMYVHGHRVDRNRMHWVGERTVIAILPYIPFGGKGDRGGVITGKVVDKHGESMGRVKVSATPVSGGILSFFGSNYAETKTNSRGMFALEFDGCLQVKELSVDGDHPQKMQRKTKSGEMVEYKSSVIEAGSFGLELTANRRTFGSLFSG